MDNIRFRALEISMERKRKPVEFPDKKASEYFGEMTFNSSAMKKYLPPEGYKQLTNVIEKGGKIDRKTADIVAAGMKAWALSKGATSYTHWFFPLTGLTAEKHDSFLDPVEGGKAIEHFSGSHLSQHEPDASSFPSGGMRSTFEARGYTAWDPTSPAFIIDRTLCIPTLFVSYTGEALDFKTPLLKSLAAIDKAAADVCGYFGNSVSKVHATLGWEQEYFLVDSALYSARPDLVLTGRTLFGNASAKDQQLEDHYLGAIPQRVISFMQELEIEAHRLGIPIKTRHNEVAPNQYECAPVFEEANLSVDHNQLIMHLMENIARKHDFTVLFHEKPYSGVNGSGKHNNWSLATDSGENLLSPGKNKLENQRFLTFLVNIVKAVHEHADLIRAIIATPGNDHRLGANEAPPAIISVFLGTHLSGMIDMIAKSDRQIRITSRKGSATLFKNLPLIPEILVDETDRNRTSPFAFTGNKFEFRAVGSSQTCAPAMIVLNLILADQLKKFKADVDKLILKKTSSEDAIFTVLRQYIQESRNILFEGNNYSREWLEEAARRNLANHPTTPRALKALVSRKTIRLFEGNRVLTGRELKARHEIHLEDYIKKLQIESRVLGDLTTNHIIPGAIRYLNTLCECVQRMGKVLDRQTFSKVSQNQVETITEISEHIAKVKGLVHEMLEARKAANKVTDTEARAFDYCEKVFPYFDQIRYFTNKLELLTDDEIWPLPKYREMLFGR
jgi:glutamine synthetase